MNKKKYQQFVPLCIVLGLVIVVMIVFLICKPKVEEFNELNNQVAEKTATRQQLEEQIKTEEIEQNALENKINAMKPIFETNLVEEEESLGVFGNMFEDIIQTIQRNGLLIRSIEYNMNPAVNPLYSNEKYNVCELKFFLVATYGQLLAFLNDMNTNFKYLTSISNLSVSAFESNTDYLLVNESIVLYSKRPDGSPRKIKPLKKDKDNAGEEEEEEEEE